MQDASDLWNLLRNNWTDVDYALVSKHVAVEATHIEPACAGGMCEFVAKI